ncbi:MAG TPA: hypothetical protein VGN12_01090 [Pirellulales bacterium]
MARSKINKAAKIREAFEKLGPTARSKDIIAALAAQKIDVSSSQVSNIKAVLNGHTNGKKGRRGDALSLDDLQATKRLVDALGSIERVENALSALAKLR